MLKDKTCFVPSIPIMYLFRKKYSVKQIFIIVNVIICKWFIAVLFFTCLIMVLFVEVIFFDTKLKFFTDLALYIVELKYISLQRRT